MKDFLNKGFRLSILGAFVLVVCVGTGGVLAQEPLAGATEQQRLIFEAGRASTEGNLAVAITLFEKAQAIATAAGDLAAAGEAALSRARLLEQFRNAGGEETPSIEKVEEAYKSARGITTGAMKNIAANDLGMLYLKQGRIDEAAEVMRGVVSDSEDPNRAIYRYNFGRIMEAKPDYRAAYDWYSQAFTERPTFQPAVEHAFHLLLENKWSTATGDSIMEASKAINLLLIKGETQTAGQKIHSALGVWSEVPKSEQLWMDLLSYYRRASIGSVEFEATESRFLSELKGESSQQAFKEIRWVFGPAMAATAEQFPFWSTAAHRARFSTFVRTMGDIYCRQPESSALDEALARYKLAWTVNPLNDEARAHAAGLFFGSFALRESHRGDLDELVKYSVIDSTAESKEAAREPSFRFHTLLGWVFASEKKWGPASDQRTALFQWQRAEFIDKKLRETNRSLPPAIGLHTSLADAYAGAERQDLAWSEYQEVARELAKAGQTDGALNALERAAAFEGVISPEQRVKAADLKARIMAQPKLLRK
jgi:tetratricopeptide (TPR) repeat protein